MTRPSEPAHDGAPTASVAPEYPTTSAVPEDVGHVRALLALLADSAGSPGERLAATCALAHLDDVFPPYPPIPPTLGGALGEELLEEAVSALLGLIAAAREAGLRGRALLALHELTAPVPPLLEAGAQR